MGCEVAAVATEWRGLAQDGLHVVNARREALRQGAGGRIARLANLHTCEHFCEVHTPNLSFFGMGPSLLPQLASDGAVHGTASVAQRWGACSPRFPSGASQMRSHQQQQQQWREQHRTVFHRTCCEQAAAAGHRRRPLPVTGCTASVGCGCGGCSQHWAQDAGRPSHDQVHTAQLLQAWLP